ncbi:MAG: TMEM175 family protein [Novosphingobium sp.]
MNKSGNKQTDHGSSLSFERVAFFSDAVFAIAITLLVIDLRLPHLESASDTALINGLLGLIPQYVGFFVSFFVIGRFWIGHHQLFALIKRADDTFVWRNLLLLLSIAFMPFPTAVVGEFAGISAGVCFYALWLAFAGWQNLRLVQYAQGRLAAPGADKELTIMVRNAWLPIAIGLATFALGLFAPLLALVPLIASPLIVKLSHRYFGG